MTLPLLYTSCLLYHIFWAVLSALIILSPLDTCSLLYHIFQDLRFNEVKVEAVSRFRGLARLSNPISHPYSGSCLHESVSTIMPARIIFMILNEGSFVSCALNTDLSEWRTSWKPFLGSGLGGKMSTRMQRIIFMILIEGPFVWCALNSNLIE